MLTVELTGASFFVTSQNFLIMKKVKTFHVHSTAVAVSASGRSINALIQHALMPAVPIAIANI